MNPTQLFILYIRSRNSGSETLSYMIRQYSKQTRVFMKTAGPWTTTASSAPQHNTSLKSEDFLSFRVLFRQKKWKWKHFGKVNLSQIDVGSTS